MTWETFSCCCVQQPCNCAGVYSSITIKWTGDVTFKALPCREYWRRWVSDPFSNCGFSSRIVLSNTTTFTIPSIVVPGLNASSCSSYGCVQRQSQVDRYFSSFSPSPGTPEYLDPNYRCQFDTLDTISGPYQFAYRHQVRVFGPNQIPPFNQPPIPYWRVRIQIGTVALQFISDTPSYSCTPGQFILDPSFPMPDPDACHGPCITDGPCVTLPGPECSILNPPPSGVYPGGFVGSVLAHSIHVNVGKVEVG